MIGRRAMRRLVQRTRCVTSSKGKENKYELPQPSCVFTWVDDDKRRRGRPNLVLRKQVWERDKGNCQVASGPADVFDFELAHDKAHAKGGKLNLNNTFVAHPSCNRSMGTDTIKQILKDLGLPAAVEDWARAKLKGLTLQQLKYLAKCHTITLKARRTEYLFSTEVKAPGKTRYVNSLAPIIKPEAIDAEGDATVSKRDTKEKAS